VQKGSGSMPEMSRFVFEPARPGDSDEILEIMEQGFYPGNISLLYTRRDNAYESLMKEGEDVFITLCRDTAENKIAAFGTGAVRTIYVNREPTPIGYLFGLKARPDYRGYYRFLHNGYAYFHRVVKDKNIPFFLMTILEGNTYAVKLLEKKRAIMPDHHYLGDYEVYSFKTGLKCKTIPGFRFRPCEMEDIPAVVRFLEREGKTHQFFPVVKAQWLAGESRNDISYRDFRLLTDDRDRIVACGAMWDQGKYKQYIVKGYSGILKMTVPFSFVLPLFGYPDMLAKPGTVLNFFTLSFWAVKDNDAAIFNYFLQNMSRCGRHPFFIVGIHERNSLKKVLTKLPHFRYKSRVYLVDWDKSGDRPRTLEKNLIPYLECGML